MADESLKKENDQRLNGEVATHNDLKALCNLSIPSIVSALHRKAIKEVGSKHPDFRIANSAVEDDGKSEKLTSAGEHIISVVSKDDQKKIEKKDALPVFKTYVTWFVGPDLANKVTENEVLALGDGDPQQVKESKFNKNFLEFLLESAEEGNEEEGGAEEGNEEEGGAEEGNEEEGGAEEGNKEETDPRKKTTALGFYIAYNLKIEGMKSTVLKDAMKKFAKNLFDQITVTPSGLFGGGSAFTFGDVRKGLRDLFGLGGIDPNELIRKLEDLLKRKFPEIGDRNDIRVRDKNTLLKVLKSSNLNGKEKEKIDKAEYSIWLKVEEADQNKPFLNKAVVADLVTSSIKGIVSKAKHAITKDDVILIKHFSAGEQEDDDLRKFEHNVKICDVYLSKLSVSLKDGKLTIGDKVDPAKAIDKLDKHLNKISKNKYYSKSASTAQPIHNKISEFLEEYKKKLSSISKEDILELAQKIKDWFENDFKKLNEKIQSSANLIDKKIILESLLELLFEDYKINRVNSNNRRLFNRSDNQTHNSIMSILFNEEDEEASSETSDSDNTENQVEKNSADNFSTDENDPLHDDSKEVGVDLYIIPMPGLKYPEDEEHDSKWSSSEK